MSTYCALVVRYFMNSAVVAPARSRITTARRTETGFLMMHSPCVSGRLGGESNSTDRVRSMSRATVGWSPTREGPGGDRATPDHTPRVEDCARKHREFCNKHDRPAEGARRPRR